MVRLNFKNQGCKMGVLAKHTNFSGLREKYNMGGLKLGSAACNSNKKRQHVECAAAPPVTLTCKYDDGP